MNQPQEKENVMSVFDDGAIYVRFLDAEDNGVYTFGYEIPNRERCEDLANKFNSGLPHRVTDNAMTTMLLMLAGF